MSAKARRGERAFSTLAVMTRDSEHCNGCVKKLQSRGWVRSRTHWSSLSSASSMARRTPRSRSG